MPHRRRSRIEVAELVGSIEAASLSYFVSEDRQIDERITDDEAILNITARIDRVDTKYRVHLGQPLEISLLTAGRFRKGTIEPATIALFSITLRRNQRSMLCYLPRDAFWAMLPRIENGSVRFIEVRFEQTVRGTGAVTSLYFTQAAGSVPG